MRLHEGSAYASLLEASKFSHLTHLMRGLGLRGWGFRIEGVVCFFFFGLGFGIEGVVFFLFALRFKKYFDWQWFSAFSVLFVSDSELTRTSQAWGVLS